MAMLSDIRMPEMTGLELVPKAHAMDYLMKPVELGDRATALERGLHKRALAIEQRKVERLIREEVAAQTEELRLERQRLHSVVVDTVQALVRAQEAKDPFLRGHSDRVSDLASSIASALGLPDEEVDVIRMAAHVMDVGKIGIRESVLNKLGGRILHAADTYDALTSRRPWRDPMSPADAIAFLEERSGRLLDPKVFAALRGIVTRRKTLSFLNPESA